MDRILGRILLIVSLMGSGFGCLPESPSPPVGEDQEDEPRLINLDTLRQPQSQQIPSEKAEAPDLKLTAAEADRLATEYSTTNKLKDLIDSYLVSAKFNGSILVARGGAVLVQGAGGIAQNRGKPIDTRTRYRLGETSMMFTAVAVLQLQEQGLLSLNDSVKKHFPYFEHASDAMTIAHLLNHTSGLPPKAFHSTVPVSAGDILKAIVQVERLEEPGMHYRPSLAGMQLLALLVQKITKTPFEQYLKEHVFTPAGMMESGISVAQQNADRMADGMIRVGHELRDTNWYAYNDDPNFIWGTGSSNVYASLGDLHKFYQALQADKLLNQSSRELLWRQGQLAGGEKIVAPTGSYGHGFALYSCPDDHQIMCWTGHAGGLGEDGFYSRYLHSLDSDLVIVGLSNLGSESGRQKLDALIEDI